jgi:hypothetical protein
MVNNMDGCRGRWRLIHPAIFGAGENTLYFPSDGGWRGNFLALLRTCTIVPVSMALETVLFGVPVRMTSLGDKMPSAGFTDREISSPWEGILFLICRNIMQQRRNEFTSRYEALSYSL